MLIAALLLAALPAAAHLYPIAPARVTLSLEPERLVADVRADSIYWIEEVLQIHPLPLSGWSGETRARAEAYVNARLRLRADGAPLTGRLVAASYVQRPWQINEQGEVRLRLAYPPPPPGAALAGEADFYEEYRQEMLEHLKGKPFPKNQEFATVVRVRGAGRRFALRPGSVSFSLRADEARRGRAGRSLDAATAGAAAVLGAAAAWPALLALGLALGPARRSAALTAALAAVAGAALAAGRPAPEAAPWLSGAAAAAAAGGWAGAAASSLLAAAAWAGLGWTWGTAAAPLLPSAAPSAALRAAAATGSAAAAAAALALVSAAAAAERRRLLSVSESRAEELFARRRRLAATALLIAGACGALQAP